MSLNKSFRLLRIGQYQVDFGNGEVFPGILFVGNKPTRCLFSTESGSGADATKGTATAPPQKPSPPPATSSAGTFDNTKYQCQEYYKHNEMSFYETEISMTNKRVGQPSSKTK